MMLALTFTCRALLVVLLSESVQTDRTAPFLITENMWPRGCVLDCQRGRHRAVCGTNGRLYKSLCAFQRAQCINTQLRLAPRAHCSDPSQSKCQLARTQALEASTHNSGGHVHPAAAVFVPECHPDGHFLPVQCHNQTGYCWCSTADGKPVSGTSVLHVIPNCTDHINKLAQITDADSAPVQDDTGEAGPTPDPRKPAELTAPPFWVTILMNSDPKETAQSDDLLMRSARQEERFIPECTADGRYSPVQCHAATGYCWCVRVESGRPLPGTSERNHIPDCTGAEEAPADRRLSRSSEEAVPAESGQSSAAGSRACWKSESLPTLKLTSLQLSIYTCQHSDLLLFDAGRCLSSCSRGCRVLQARGGTSWHFSQLDVDSSGVLSEREARPLRQFLRRRLKPRRCAKKFAQYCDRDGDRGLTLEELRVCLGL
ncbi:SPARC-related modular calcium-binding protein 1 Secreted modular calcium-binding protein 1 [Larimichthys crocea]|uniref:SPARC-related modular calcium-binding protein 1 Secreted modular calcium-binding protein 1 n=1 Tax=Larimichthys crocea TaxID=215358 RepID=A0A6G0ITU4_LARCR|nr:SPARC-related modular calcium-binding protein 1 Secreted modular calcium-binding protein 1 [Larimichthys crocea]